MGKGLKLQKGKNLTRQFPWTWKGIIIEFYLRDRLQKTLQVELELSKNNREPWHWETTATLEILEQRQGA
jgi:hypothetical protein